MVDDEPIPNAQPALLPSQLEFLRGLDSTLHTLAPRPDLGALEQHIEESLSSVLQLQGTDSAAFRLAVAAMSGGATRNSQTVQTAVEAITTSPLLREDGRQLVAGLLGTVTTLRNNKVPEKDITQRLVETASTALGTIRKSDNYANPSMRAAELAVLSFYAGATLRDENFDATQQLMDFAAGLMPGSQA